MTTYLPSATDLWLITISWVHNDKPQDTLDICESEEDAREFVEMRINEQWEDFPLDCEPDRDVLWTIPGDFVEVAEIGQYHKYDVPARKCTIEIQPVTRWIRC